MQTIESIHGLILVLFISLIIRSILLRKARESKLLDKMTIEDILLEMSKLRPVYIGEEWHLTEITRKQREILTKLGVKIAMNIVTKNTVI